MRDRLIEVLGRPSQFGPGLSSTRLDAVIVSNVGRALSVLSKRQTEQQRLEAGILLRAIASPLGTRAEYGANASIARRIGEFVGKGNPIPMGSRTVRGHRYEHAFTIAIRERTQFDKEAREAGMSVNDLVAGDFVLCRGVAAQLAWYDETTGRCGVTFSHGGLENTLEYASRFREKGQDPRKSARLQRLQPSLMPPPRKKRSDATSVETEALVRDFYEAMCPVSPHMADARKRHMGRHLVQVGR